MKYEVYQNLIATTNFLEYEFVSEGPKGFITKIIQFTQTDNPDIFNLSFGNKLANGELDDSAIDDNKDRNKILATVASNVRVFTDKHPQKWVFFTGSTPQRTRLYKMAISLNYFELALNFEIFGVQNDIEGFVIEPFDKKVNYFGFLIRKKLV